MHAIPVLKFKGTANNFILHLIDSKILYYKVIINIIIVIHVSCLAIIIL